MFTRVNRITALVTKRRPVSRKEKKATAYLFGIFVVQKVCPIRVSLHELETEKLEDEKADGKVPDPVPSFLVKAFTLVQRHAFDELSSVDSVSTQIILRKARKGG